MKKSVLTILGVGGLIGILCLAFVPKENLKKLDIPFTKGEESQEKMKFINYGLPSDYQNGYFYIKSNSNRKNIMYFDYDSKKEVYLCNKPNCKHDNPSCSSYSFFAEANELFYYQDALYFINSSAIGETIYATADGAVDNHHASPTTIYKMNLDGTDKQKVFTAPSGAKISTPFVMRDNMMYGYLEKRKIESNGENSFKPTTYERNLVAINLETGDYASLQEGRYASLIGFFHHQLVIQVIDYLQDPNSFGDDTNAYRKNLYQSKTKIKLFDLETKKEEIIYEDIYQNMESMQFYKNGIYFIGKGSRLLEYFDFSTKKKEVIKELPYQNMSLGTIIDDKLLVYFYEDNYTRIGGAYSIDLVNHDMNPFTLRDKDDGLIDILASNDDYYFVQLETIFGDEYTTWAGTKQRKFIGINYGLIKKNDYWNSLPVYTKMANAK